MRSAFRQSARGDKNISDNCPCHVTRLLEARLSLPPHHIPNRSHAAHHSSCYHIEAHEKPPHAQQESQCVRRLKERIARMGGLGKNEFPNYLMIIRQFSYSLLEFATSTIYNPDVNLLVSMLAFFCPSWRFCEQTTCPAALTTVSNVGA